MLPLTSVGTRGTRSRSQEGSRWAVPRLTGPAVARQGPWQPPRRYWHGNEPEWDLVADAVDGRQVFVGECRFSQRPVTDAALRRDAARLEARPLPPPVIGRHVVRALFRAVDDGGRASADWARACRDVRRCTADGVAGRHSDEAGTSQTRPGSIQPRLSHRHRAAQAPRTARAAGMATSPSGSRPSGSGGSSRISLTRWSPDAPRTAGDLAQLSPARQAAWYEWAVAQELFRRAAVRGDADPDRIPYRQGGGHEIDFVLGGGEYIEVKRGRATALDFTWFRPSCPRSRLTVICATPFEAGGVRGVTLETFLSGHD